MKNKIIAVLFAAALGVVSGSAAFADTTVITTGHSPYFHSYSNPVASLFYFVGDVVVLPFRLVGDLFS